VASLLTTQRSKERRLKPALDKVSRAESANVVGPVEVDLAASRSLGRVFDPGGGPNQHERLHAGRVIDRLLQQHASAHRIADVMAASAGFDDQLARTCQISVVVMAVAMPGGVYCERGETIGDQRPEGAPTAGVLGEAMGQDNRGRIGD